MGKRSDLHFWANHVQQIYWCWMMNLWLASKYLFGC